MVTLVYEVQKEPWELTESELKHNLDWETVTPEQFQNMPEEYFVYVPDIKMITDNRSIDSMSEAAAFNLLRRLVKECKKPTNRWFMDNSISAFLKYWCSTEFLMINIVKIKRLLSSIDMHLSSSYVSLVHKGVLDINEVDINFGSFSHDELNLISIPVNSRFHFLKSTNYLYLNIHDYNDEPIALPCCMIQELGLPVPNVSITVSQSDTEDYYWGSEAKNIRNAFGDSPVQWDLVLQLYFEGKLNYDDIQYVWMTIFEEYPHLIEDAGLSSITFKREGQPTNSSKGAV